MKEDLESLPGNLIRGGFQSQSSSEGGYERLTRQEREKALKAAREVVAEAKKLLGSRYSTIMFDPKSGRSLTILGNQPEEEITPLDPELTIATSQYKGIGHDKPFDFHLYYFYKDHVNHLMSYTRTQGGRIIEQRETVGEAKAEDLTRLLQYIRDSHPRKE